MDIQIQNQINDLNRKMDIVLNYIQEKEARDMRTDDLLQDLSIVGNDIYHSMVSSLDIQQVEIDPETIKHLGIKVLRNLETLSQMVDLLESINDLLNDASPLLNEAIIDFSHFLQNLNEKGYFEALEALFYSIDKIVTVANPDAIRDIGDQAEKLGEIFNNISNPELLEGLNQMLVALNNTIAEKPKPISPYNILLKPNKPELKQGLGFIMTFLKNINNK